MTRHLALLGLLGGAAAAQEPPSLIGVPLDVDPTPSLMRLHRALDQTFYAALEARSGAIVPPRRETDAILRELKTQRFRDSDENLARAADAAGTEYALYSGLHVSDERVLLTGRVVRNDGKLMASASARRTKGRDSLAVILSGLEDELFGELGLSTLPSTRPMSAEATGAPTASVLTLVAPEDPVPPVATGSTPAPAPGRLVAYGLLGVGLAGVALGATLFATAGAVTQDASHNIAASDSARVPVVRQRQAVAAGLLGGGAALGAAGVVLWLLTKSQSSVVVTWWPGGGAVVAGGVWP